MMTCSCVRPAWSLRVLSVMLQMDGGIVGALIGEGPRVEWLEAGASEEYFRSKLTSCIERNVQLWAFSLPAAGRRPNKPHAPIAHRCDSPCALPVCSPCIAYDREDRNYNQMNVTSAFRKPHPCMCRLHVIITKPSTHSTQTSSSRAQGLQGGI
jgi:hypothetical protein